MKKTRRAALLMSVSAVLPAVIVLGVFRVVEWLLGGAPVNDEVIFSVAAEACFLPFIVMIVTTLLAVMIGALDARHYGQAAARRWILIGAGFGAWWAAAARLLPDFDSYLTMRVVQSLLQVGCALWLYWLAFRMFPPRVSPENSEDHPDETTSNDA